MSECELSTWPAREHVATSWSVGAVSGRRVGTRYWYEKDLPVAIGEKGFMWRPKYLKYKAALKAREASNE